MTLSPATQAVVSAIQESSYDWGNMDQAHPNVIAAAALRAVADQVGIRQELLAIAAELEGAS